LVVQALVFFGPADILGHLWPKVSAGPEKGKAAKVADTLVFFVFFGRADTLGHLVVQTFVFLFTCRHFGPQVSQSVGRSKKCKAAK